jgi:hypothetical protein
MTERKKRHKDMEKKRKVMMPDARRGKMKQYRTHMVTNRKD